MFLCRSATILGYVFLIQMDTVYCFNISWIQPISPNTFSIAEYMGIRHITSDILREYENITVREMINSI